MYLHIALSCPSIAYRFFADPLTSFPRVPTGTQSFCRSWVQQTIVHMSQFCVFAKELLWQRRVVLLALCICDRACLAHRIVHRTLHMSFSFPHYLPRYFVIQNVPRLFFTQFLELGSFPHVLIMSGEGDVLHAD